MPRKYFKAAEIFGFGSLIVLIGIIGVIGIFQVRYLSGVVEVLGTQHLRSQRAALEMRISNSLYGRSIRDFVFWRTSKLLEAVPRAADLRAQNEAIQNFDKYLAIYTSYNLDSTKQALWVDRLKDNVSALRGLGEGIVQEVETVPGEPAFKDFSKLLMKFENRLFQIDEFLINTVEKNILDAIAWRLVQARIQRRNAIVLLSVCLLLCISMGGVIAFWVYLRNRSEEEKKRQLLSQMLSIEDNERKNLSLQVHNEMGQDLSALKIYLKLKNFPQCESILETLSEKAHNISYLLRPPVLEEIGIVSALEALILRYKHMTGHNYMYFKPDREITIPSEYNLILYRVAQEALTNAAKYSKAENVKLSLKQEVLGITLSIEDDGVGFDYSRFLKEGPKVKLGLLGLKERIEVFDGTMHIDSAHGAGTRIIVELKLNRNQNANNSSNR